MFKPTFLSRSIITAILLVKSVTVIASEKSLGTFVDKEAFIISSFEKTCRMAEGILETLSDECTFENMLGKWMQITDEVALTMRTLDSTEDSQDAYDYLCLCNAEIFESPVLRDVLFSYARYVSKEELDPYQRYVVDCFLENTAQRKTKLVFSSMSDLVGNNEAPSIGLINYPEQESHVRLNYRSQYNTFEMQPANFINLCRHKEKIEIEHEKDDNGKSRTKVGVQFEYENKNGYWAEAEARTERKEENNKSSTENSAEIRAGKKF